MKIEGGGDKMRVYLKVFILVIITGLLCISKSVALEDNISPKEKKFLLDLSRQTLYWYLEDGSVPKIEKKYQTSGLLQKRSCFVTLRDIKGNLRGCMGMFDSVDMFLYENVIDRTVASLTKDSRFANNRINYDDLNSILIEISVLGKARPLEFTSPESLLSKLNPGIDGVILTTPYGSSTYLPQVWGEIPDKELFLSNLCKKHGAPFNYWKEYYKNIRIEIYNVVHFSEEVPGPKVVGKKRCVVGEDGGVILGHVLPLDEGLEYGVYPAKKGQELRPGTLVSSDTILVEADRLNDGNKKAIGVIRQ